MPDRQSSRFDATTRRLATLLVLAATALVGCVSAPRASLDAASLQGGMPTPAETGGVELAGAGREWLDLVVKLGGNPTTLRLAPLRGDGGEHRADARLYRVADVPADLNHAAYLRLHGERGPSETLPRALLPVTQGGDGSWPAVGLGGGRLWLDLRLPAGLPRGRFATSLEAIGPAGEVLASLPIRVASHGFDLPERLPLTVAAAASWDRLERLWPGRFAGQSPTLLSRGDEASRPAVGRLDKLVALARDDGLTLTFPQVVPVVKWPAGRPPEAYWSEYDALVGPWLAEVHAPVWPAPKPMNLDDYGPAARREYWRSALGHLDQIGRLDRYAVRVDDDQADAPEAALSLSAEAGRVAQSHDAGTVAVALGADEVRFSGPDNPGLYPPDRAGRLMIRADGPVDQVPARPWPAGLPTPLQFLEVESGDAPAGGPAATLADVRMWGWLAFVRGASVLDAGHALPPDSADDDPTRPIWFYPGEAFDLNGPVPSVQLKWLRRARQDHAYLALAADRLEEPYARVIARTLVRPVRRDPGTPVPTDLLPLLGGSVDAAAWRQGLGLVADKIALADPAIRPTLDPSFAGDHVYRTTSWLFPREREALAVVATRWDLLRDQTKADGGGGRLYLRSVAAVYNPSDARPEGATLSVESFPGGDAPGGSAAWQTPGDVKIEPVPIYGLAVATVAASAPVDSLAGQVRLGGQAPMRIALRDDYDGATSHAEVTLPAAVLDRRSEPPQIDGRLGEWSGHETLVDGPMVRMHARPGLQAGRVARGDSPATAYAGWSEAGLHVAFRVTATPRPATGERVSRNFVETEAGRVWGEDAVEVLIGPTWLVRGDPTPGPLLTIVCKPEGAFARRREDRRLTADPWRSFESGLRYAATLDAAGAWRAEMTIPWEALRAAGWPAAGSARPGEAAVPGRVPALLRFNLSHHDAAAGQGTSWAGPVDSGGDDAVTGAIVLRGAESLDE